MEEQNSPANELWVPNNSDLNVQLSRLI